MHVGTIMLSPYLLHKRTKGDRAVGAQAVVYAELYSIVRLAMYFTALAGLLNQSRVAANWWSIYPLPPMPRYWLD